MLENLEVFMSQHVNQHAMPRLARYKPYLLNLGLTTLILMGLAIFKGFTPFGSNSMLTIDLGQQYIDFFSLFRQTLTQTPEQFLYSFQKGYGGEMIGVWAYYLMSPFNLILLLFDEQHLAAAVTLLTYLKLAGASLTFFYFARKKYHTNTVMGSLFANAYALMSYTFTYMLNIMWFDVLVFLPLIALGLDRIMTQRRSKLYVIMLAVSLISNYYIGFMMCIFLAFYAGYVIFEKFPKVTIKSFIQHYSDFVIQSLMGAAISAMMLIPTFMALLSSKATHTKTDWNWDVAHNLEAIGSKLFLGSFVFDEIKKGSPNLYSSILVSLFVVYYFFIRKIRWQEKIAAIVVLIPFYLGFHFKIFDRLWHGGQFPIWYHFRFSFLTTFFFIILALKAFQNRRQALAYWQSILMIVSVTVYTYYYYGRMSDYKFLKLNALNLDLSNLGATKIEANLLLSLIFALMIILVLHFEFLHPKLMQVALLAVVACEIFTNGALILQELSYVQLSKFNDYVAILDKSLTGLRNPSDDFYRIHTTYQRSKNEAMYTHFNGMNHFGSTIDANAPKLFGYLGLPQTSGVVEYTNGTLFTDDLFNIRYLLDPSKDTAANTNPDQYKLYQVATDLDIQAYPTIDSQPRYVVHENTERLGLGIEVSNQLTSESNPLVNHQPIQNQEYLLSLVDYKGAGQPYFTEHELKEEAPVNVTITNRGDGDYLTYSRNSESSNSDLTKSKSSHYFSFRFNTTSENPYYFTLPSQYDGEKTKLDLNSEAYHFYGTFSYRQITNASYKKIQDNQELKVRLEKPELKANLPKLYEFDKARYDAMIASKQDHLFKVTSFKHNKITGTINTEQEEGYLLFTIPYDKHWRITDNGQPVQAISVLNDTLLAIPIKKGDHTITLHYFPMPVWIGLAVSLLGIAAFVLDQTWLKKYRKPLESASA